MNLTRLVSLASGVFLFLFTSQAGAVVIMADNFNTVDSTDTATDLPGRAPTTNTVNSSVWVANSAAAGPTATNYVGNGAGGLTITSGGGVNTASSLDLGASYLSTNPGVYTLSLSINQSATGTQGWVGLGFATSSSTTEGLATNGYPWLLYRMNGQVSVFSGPGTTVAAISTTAATGTARVLSLVLDTSATAWTLGASVDGTAIDLNGGAAGSLFTYGTNPTGNRYLTIGTGGSGTVGNATVDNFSLDFVAVPEPSRGVLLCVAGMLMLSVRRRRLVA